VQAGNFIRSGSKPVSLLAASRFRRRRRRDEAVAGEEGAHPVAHLALASDQQVAARVADEELGAGDAACRMPGGGQRVEEVVARGDDQRGCGDLLQRQSGLPGGAGP